LKSGIEGITLPPRERPTSRPRQDHEARLHRLRRRLHAKRVASLAGAAVGVLEGAALGIHAIGKALAMAEGLKTKHAVKQVDRLLGNDGIMPWSLFASWVPFVVGDRPEIVTALDWTDFDDDNQSTIVLSMITSHGRATPLLWKTVVKSELKGWRNEHEDLLLERFREVLPAGVKVTVLADRGFGDQALYELLRDQLGFDFVVRFRGIVKVTSADGMCLPAKDRVPANGRPLLLRAAKVTKRGRELGAVVCVKAKGMKEAWHLATSYGDKPASEIVALYGRRFTIEESFRDQKNLRFGMGLGPLGNPDRRSRAARPHASRERHRHRAAHDPRRGRRGDRHRPVPQVQHGQAANHIAAQPGPDALRRSSEDEARHARAPHGQVRRTPPRTTRLPRRLRAHLNEGMAQHQTGFVGRKEIGCVRRYDKRVDSIAIASQC
jgi:DDE family transposase